MSLVVHAFPTLLFAGKIGAGDQKLIALQAHLHLKATAAQTSLVL
jgi:hypothetical protein